jgi:DNA mismatch endonuclease (patch repair protein)
MVAQKRVSTAPELALRKQLFAIGLRFRVNYQPSGLRCRCDVAFTRHRVAVFVDGCFWHSCPLHATQPKANAGWWRAKLAENVARDRRIDAALASTGWTSVRVWEHEDVVAATQRVLRELDRHTVAEASPHNRTARRPSRLGPRRRA